MSLIGQSGAKDNFSIAEEKRTNSINSKADSKVSRSSKYNGININQNNPNFVQYQGSIN